MDVLQAAAVAQCTTIYLAIAHRHMGSGPEDYVVIEYESWMEVSFPVPVDRPNFSAQLIADALCQSSVVHP
jgi:hypothetical protein